MAGHSRGLGKGQWRYREEREDSRHDIDELERLSHL